MGRKRPAAAVTNASTIIVGHPTSTTGINFLTLPYEIRHRIYTFIHPTFKVNILKSRNRTRSKLTYEVAPRPPHHCRHEIPSTFRATRRITATILCILLTCKQVKEEYESVLRSTHTFRICLDGSSVNTVNGHLVNLLDFKPMAPATLHSFRKIMLTFDSLDQDRGMNYWGSDLECLAQVSRGFNPNRKRPARDAVARSMFGHLTSLDVHLLQPPRSRLRSLPHGETTIRRYELWLKSIEPVLRVIGRGVGLETEVRVHYDTKDVELALLTRELVERCFTGGSTTCHVDGEKHGRALPGLCRRKDCPTRFTDGPVSLERARVRSRLDAFAEQSGAAGYSPEEIARYAEEVDLVYGLGIPR